jgi:hypothetical protein
MAAEILPVADFPAAREAPLSYPGKRPNHSFVTDGKLVYPVDFEGPSIKSARIRTPGKVMLLDDYLKENGLAPLGERFPVMEYGSNASPGQLKSKFGDDEIIPVIRANMNGWDAVYNFMSRFGYAFAELMPQAPTGLDVTVTLLDGKQVPVMNETEPNYALSVFPKLTFESGETIDALGYAGVSAIFVSSTHNSPIALKEIPAYDRQVPELFQRELLALAIEELGLGKRYNISQPEELAELVRKEGLGGPAITYIKEAVADGRSLSKSTAFLVEQEPDASKPRRTLDDSLKAA